ncbi:putative ribonuclease H-like domain-containing protein, partial [Tanacetum coccineum]
GNPPTDDQGYMDSGCSRHMTGNISYLLDFQEFNGGYVTFRGRANRGKITSKGTLKTGKLDFQDVFFVKELKFNLFSISHICDKKNCVLFTDIACYVLSPDFKLPDASLILLEIPRKNNMYSVDMKNIVPKESLTCLVAKATLDESMLWHRMLGHIYFKTINKLVKDNLVRGLPSKRFENDQTCVACLKGKQHKASCKSKVQNSITQPLFMLHMDLFGPTFVSSLMNNKYCLVITDDYSRFTWVFFLASKNETSSILKNFITEIENLADKKVKIIKSENGTEFKKRVMIEFCEQKGIKREYSVARTPQQNGVAKRRNRTLIEAARTMLADSKLPITFWAEVVNTTCYVQNRVIIIKPHNKTPYELFRGRNPAMSFMRTFGCHVSILNTLDHLGKFDGKSDDRFLVGYPLTSKAFRVYNIRTKRVEENLHIRFLEDKPIISGDGPKWLFDLDSLTKSMNYVPVIAGTISNDFAGSKVSIDEGSLSKETKTNQGYIVMPLSEEEDSVIIFEFFIHIQCAVYDDKTHESLLLGLLRLLPITRRIQREFVKPLKCPSCVVYSQMDVKEVYFPFGRLKRIGYMSISHQQKEDRKFISQDKYVDEILKKFNYSDVRTASTPVDLEKPLVKDGDANDVDVHLYRSTIRSLMYLTTSRPDIMFVIFEGKPTLGLWYLRDSPFELVAYSDSDYVGATQDRKSTTGRYLLIKGFDARRFQYLVSSIGMLNP